MVALQGLPGGKGIGTIRQGEDNCLALCENRSRHAVTLHADSRVLVEEVD